jgi:hypothetical protein
MVAELYIWLAGHGGKIPIMPRGYSRRSHINLKSASTVLIVTLFSLNYLCTLSFGQKLDIGRFDNFYLTGSTNINLTDFSLLINSDVCDVAKVCLLSQMERACSVDSIGF